LFFALDPTSVCGPWKSAPRASNRHCSPPQTTFDRVSPSSPPLVVCVMPPPIRHPSLVRTRPSSFTAGTLLHSARQVPFSFLFHTFFFAVEILLAGNLLLCLLLFFLNLFSPLVGVSLHGDFINSVRRLSPPLSSSSLFLSQGRGHATTHGPCPRFFFFGGPALRYLPSQAAGSLTSSLVFDPSLRLHIAPGWKKVRDKVLRLSPPFIIFFTPFSHYYVFRSPLFSFPCPLFFSTSSLFFIHAVIHSRELSWAVFPFFFQDTYPPRFRSFSPP